MAGGKKIDIIKLAKLRDDSLKKANVYFLKMKKLEEKAEEIDDRISNICPHPKSHQRLKHFDNSIPQKSFWLCTLCYQSIGTIISKKSETALEAFIDEVWEEMPGEWAKQ